VSLRFTLYVARHGQTDANVANRYPGRRETPLTTLGREQARAMGRALLAELGPRPTLKFVASPLGRAQATMRLIRAELELQPDGFASDARLLDIDHGDWTGLTPQEVRARFPENFAEHTGGRWDVPMSGGESYGDLAARVESFLAEIDSNVVTVSHGATSQMLRGLPVGIDPVRITQLPETQGVVFRVRDNVVTQLDS